MGQAANAASVKSISYSTGELAEAALPLAAVIGALDPGDDRQQQLVAALPVGFQNSASRLDLLFYAARSYSLMRPPRTARRVTRSRAKSATGWLGRVVRVGHFFLTRR